MEKRKTEDIFEISGRKFILTKYDPLTGNYLLVKILSFALPFGLTDRIADKIGIDISKNTMQQITKKDFVELQRDILSTVYEQLPGNRAPLINDNGSYGVADLTMGITVNLLIASLAFNFAGFFEDAGLSELLSEHMDSDPANTQP